MSQLFSLIRLDKEYRHVLDTLRGEATAPAPLPTALSGLSVGAATAFTVTLLRDRLAEGAGPILVLAPGEDEAHRLLSVLDDPEEGVRALYYPSRDLMFHSVTASHDTDRERLSVLSALLAGRVDVVVTTAPAALLRTIPPQLLAQWSVSLRVGDEISPLALSEKLLSLGFYRVDMVEGQGQFAGRGGILDIAPGTGDPIRIEFFGDEIDRMEYFDPATQRVIGPAKELCLLPAEEVPVRPEARALMLTMTERLLAQAVEPALQERLTREKTALREGLPVAFADRFLPYIYPKGACLFSYFPDHCPVIALETAALAEAVKKQTDTLNEVRDGLVAAGLLPKGAPDFAYGKGAPLIHDIKPVLLYLNSFAGGIGTAKLAGLYGMRTRRTIGYGDNGHMLYEDLRGLVAGQYRILIACENKSGAKSLYDSLQTEGFSCVPLWDNRDIDNISLQNGVIYLIEGDIDEGFELLTPKLALLTMKKDTGRAVLAHRRRVRKRRAADGATEALLSYADLSPGDYVVHESYGIGIFEGIRTVSVEGVRRDYMTVRYAGTDKLFVPCDRIESIGKYIGAKEKDGTVKLSRMGGADWQRTKSRTKNALKDIAADLIRIYALRQSTPGFAYPPEDATEREFADAFPFLPTDCQQRAMTQIDADMCRSVPMNRLLCGDVGFGKTELALRAAFKAILSGKQVAMLVPTTILALQHYETALSRFRGYAVTVEMLSRFRTPAQQTRILRQLERGNIDLLIGTHKMLSKKLKFRDLGLLIIDEEQRFGVAQKERLRDLGSNIDTLVLTATPIPRTLSMAMNGISDMSVLDEAPVDRHPVQTYVCEHDELLLTDAMERELARGGQVLYLSNRVEDISLVAARIAERLPMARVTYAHGQMDKEELEDIWQMLVRGEVDILVCTTIIETGVDLPNANTLIIENADRMGLSQLHQLRGRVGRSTRQAYAYFTYRPGKVLSETAAKRLRTIREFAGFGAGFRIALRDLEIRGAGNLLGAEQHGYIDGVGYDLYVRMLSEAVAEAKGEPAPPRFESTVDLPVSAHLPESYIATSAGRMEMYKKISHITNAADYHDLLDELCDRYGEPPLPVKRLLKIAWIRALAETARIRRIEQRGATVAFICEQVNLTVWSEVFLKCKGTSLATGAPIYRPKAGEELTDGVLTVLQTYTRILSKS